MRSGGRSYLCLPDGVHALTGGERIGAGGRLRVEYTPGHAKHHVSYLDEESGVGLRWRYRRRVREPATT